MEYFVRFQGNSEASGLQIVEPLTQRGMILFQSEGSWRLVRRCDGLIHSSYERREVPTEEFSSLYEACKEQQLLRDPNQITPFNPNTTPTLRDLLQNPTSTQ